MIKELNPYQIDWSNISDYFTNKKFVKMAKACSANDTAHTAHFMNWLQRVWGIHPYDYDSNRQEVYNQTVEKVESLWLYVGKMLMPGIRSDMIVDHPINKFGQITSLKFVDSYTDYYFG